MSAILASIQNLTVKLPFGADRPYALENVTLEIPRGRIVCIVGESGSGKSLTAHAIMGLLPRGVEATSGQILFEGSDLLREPPMTMRRRRGRDIAMIFQDPMAALNPLMPVANQIAEQIRAHTNRTSKEAIAQSAELLEQMGLRAGPRIMRALPHQLSGGQRQRVMIAMALSLSPKLLIADEPTTALDVTTQAQILKLIKSSHVNREMSVLFITHDFGVVREMADDVAVMRQGQILEWGRREAVLGRPSHFYTKSLIEAVPKRGELALPKASAKPLLSVLKLSKRYRRGGIFFGGTTIKALDEVSLTLRRGETLGVVGESGSGKSTLARCLIRLLDADGGEVLFEGADLTRLSLRRLRSMRRRIQMVFQDPYSSLNPRHTVGQILTRGPRAFGEDKRESIKRAGTILGLVGLGADVMRRYPHEFSGGQCQRIGLARALMLKPDILIADEPVSALDMTVQAQVLKLLDNVRQQMNLAMLFITHDMRVAAQICHRVMVMHHGRVVECGPTQEIFAKPRSDYTKALMEAIPGTSLFKEQFKNE